MTLLGSREMVDALMLRGAWFVRRMCTVRKLLYLTPLIFLAALCWGIYISHLNNVKHDLKNEAKYICDTLQRTFDFYAQLLMYISKQIAAADTEDVRTIAKIIGRDTEQNESLSWLNVGWADSRSMYVFDCTHGFLNPPHNLSHRPYIQECMKTPSRFYTSQVIIGVAIGIRIIPSGIGVTNSKGKYLGTLLGGFSLVDLNYRVQQKLNTANFNKPTISYIVLDRDLHIVLKSSDNEIDIESSYYRDALVNPKIFTSDEGALATRLVYKDIVYTHYKKVKNFPYYVLMGTNKTAARASFLWRLLPFFVGILIIISYCFLFIYSDKKEIIKHAHASERAKLSFLRSLRIEIKVLLDSICTYCEIISKSLKQDSDVVLTNEKQLEFLDKIQETIPNLSGLTNNPLCFSYIKVNPAIEDCILIHAHTALIRGIKIKTYLHPSPPPLMVDELRFKQIIAGLISMSLAHSLKQKPIKISTTLECLNNNNFLELVIENHCSSHETREDQLCNTEIGFDLATIEQLIKMHGGTLRIQSADHDREKIIIQFPYRDITYETKIFSASKGMPPC